MISRFARPSLHATNTTLRSNSPSSPVGYTHQLLLSTPINNQLQYSCWNVSVAWFVACSQKPTPLQCLQPVVAAHLSQPNVRKLQETSESAHEPVYYMQQCHLHSTPHGPLTVPLPLTSSSGPGAGRLQTLCATSTHQPL